MDWRKTLAAKIRRPPPASVTPQIKSTNESESTIDLALVKAHRSHRTNGDSRNDALDALMKEMRQKCTLLSREQIRSLFKQWRATRAPHLYEQIVLSHLRFVVSIAKDIGRGFVGMPLLDAIQEGYLGLVRAIEKFDEDRGYKLSTYACWWIRQSIERAYCTMQGTIRHPVHIADKNLRLYKIACQLQNVLGREPTLEELAKGMGMSVDALRRFHTMTQQTTALISIEGMSERSESSRDILDRLELESVKYHPCDPERTVTDAIFERAWLTEAVECLSTRERIVFSHQIVAQMSDQTETSLHVPDDRHGMMHGRTWWIKARALKKLRRRLQKYRPDYCPS